MNSEYAEYRCSACKKDIKCQVVSCKGCFHEHRNKLFYHPGCVSKHKIYDKNLELVLCQGPFDRFEIEMKKASAVTGNSKDSKDRRGSQGSTGSDTSTLTSTGSGAKGSGSSKSLNIDVKVNLLVKAIKEIKDEMICKNEIKNFMKEILHEEMTNIKRELDEIKNYIQETISETAKEHPKRKFSEVVQEKKNENVIIIKPRKQQESEATKKVMREKVDIKNLAVGVTKLRNGNNDSVIFDARIWRR
ncbi:hypothetical protein RF55_7211 [Lasius niger]|uniref:Uncharacterized protein n=1 Tax=Lasius niger TaxID=67767 RepID=A0A0J7KQY3_LASNI|nr:hypothetical protein RF55_7211 [Lasius niger]